MFLPDNRLTFIDFFRLALAMGTQGKTLSKRRRQKTGCDVSSPLFSPWCRSDVRVFIVVGRVGPSTTPGRPPLKFAGHGPDLVGAVVQLVQEKVEAARIPMRDGATKKTRSVFFHALDGP